MPDAPVSENKATSDPPSAAAPTTPPPQPWYRDGKFLVAVVAAVLGTSGIAGTVQVVLESHRKTAELEIAKMNNDAHLKLEQEKQAHGITLAREQQRHSIAEQYLQRVTDPRASYDNVETVYELIIRIEGADDTRGVSSWAKQQLRRVRERRETAFKEEELRKQGVQLKADHEEKLAALAKSGEGPDTITVDSKRAQEKYELESAALGLKLLETQKRLADLERQLQPLAA